MRNGVISLLSVLLRVRPLGAGKLGAWMWHWSPPIPPSQSSQAEDRGRETIWEATAPDPCAHMAGSSKEETSSSPGAVRVLELSSCSLLSYITRRMRRGWREWESRANEGKIRNVVEDVLLLYRLAGWQGRRVPALPTKSGCPPQAASHRGWSWVHWGTGLPLWCGFLGIERQNYVMSGKRRTNQKHRPPVNNTFFINLLLDLSSISQYFLILLSVSFSDVIFLYTDVSASSASLALVLGALPTSIQLLLWMPFICSLQPRPFPVLQPFLSQSNSPFSNFVGISNRFGQNETLTSIPSLVQISVSGITKWLMQNLGVISKTFLSSLTHSPSPSPIDFCSPMKKYPFLPISMWIQSYHLIAM